MMITRRESLERLFRMGLLLPVGLAAACAGELGAPVEEEELAVEAELADVTWEKGTAASAERKEVFFARVDPDTARQHMEAMRKCLAQRGVQLPAEGPIRIRIHAPEGSGTAGPHRKFVFKAGPGHAIEDDEANEAANGATIDIAPSDEATRKAFEACVAQVGMPGKPAR